MSDANRPILLIDGNYAVKRAWHGHAGQILTTSTGVPTGVLHGFLDSLCTLYKRFEPQDTIVCWDSFSIIRERYITEYRQKIQSLDSEHATRVLLGPGIPASYKASRYANRSPEEKESYDSILRPQRDILYQVITYLGIRQLRVQGLEGDDVIGIASRRLQDQGKIVYIISSDHDLYQLLTPAVLHYDPSKDRVTTIEDFRQNFQLEPDRWPDVKALVGDKGDDIPGIPGIAEKTALTLFHDNKIDNLPDLLAKAATVVDLKKKTTGERKLAKVQDYAEQVKFAYNMSYILASVDECSEEQRREFNTQWYAEPKISWEDLEKFTKTFELKKVWANLQYQFRTPHVQLGQVHTLDELLEVWGSACVRCPLKDTRHNIITHAGPALSDLIIINDSPTNADDYYGKPLAGTAGDYLNEFILKPYKLDREKIHITQLVCCHPEDEEFIHRDPTAIEITACMPRLLAQIRVVQPKLIVLLGDKVFKTFFPKIGNLTKYRGNQLEHPQFPGVIFFPTHHPAYVSRLAESHSDLIKARNDWKTISHLLTTMESDIILKE